MQPSDRAVSATGVNDLSGAPDDPQPSWCQRCSRNQDNKYEEDIVTGLCHCHCQFRYPVSETEFPRRDANAIASQEARGDGANGRSLTIAATDIQQDNLCCARCGIVSRSLPTSMTTSTPKSVRLKEIMNGVSRGFSHSRSASAMTKVSSSHFYAITLAMLSVILVLPAASGQWITEPQDTAVDLGGQTRLQCRVQDAERRNFIWSLIMEDNTEVKLFMNGVPWGQVPDNLDSPKEADGYDLVVMAAERDNDQKYMCAVSGIQESRGNLEATVQLTVLVAPEDPVITLNQSDPRTEGDHVEFRCSSNQGNPPPTFLWRQDGADISEAQTVNVAKFGETYSYFSKELKMTDHGSTFECEITNEAISSSIVTSLDNMDVHFAPRIDLGPYDPLKVVESRRVELTCDVTANPWNTPSDEIKWYKGSVGSSVIGSSETLVIVSVSASDSDSYICTAENRVALTTGQLQLDVHYAPVVSILSSAGEWQGDDLEVMEDQDVDLSCDTQANPPVDGSTIKWYKDDAHIATGATLQFRPIRKEDRANYYCEAGNVLEPSEGAPVPEVGRSDVIFLRVQYKPGQATVTVPELVVKGSDATLHCQVDDAGDPVATLVWTKLGQSPQIGVGPTLELKPAQLSDSDDYVCTPSNDVGNGIQDVQRFDVYEMPEWLNQPPPTLTTVISDTGVTLECELRGKPPPNIKWYHQDTGQPVDVSGGYFTVKEVIDETPDQLSFQVHSTLKLQGSDRSPQTDSLRIEDSGNYSCEATNEVNHQGELAVTLISVHYTPVLNTTTPTVAIDNNQSAVLTCQAHSLPGTTFKWYNESTGSELVSGGRIHITDDMTGGTFPYSSTLNISDVQISDLGYYVCEGFNEVGADQVRIYLTVKTVPDAPDELRVLSQTWESVELQWQPGFDGGYPQNFVITYMAPGHATETVQAEQATRYNVTNLFPSLNYTFKVYSENDLGRGSYSNNATVLTDDFTIDPPTEVYYDVETRTLVFMSPSSHYCARIDIHDGSAWNNYEPCAPTEGGSIKIDDDEVVEAIKTALCLETRHDVCSEEILADKVEESDDLPVSVIIIVAVICGVIVIILSVILIILCCRRHQAKKKYEEATSHTVQPVMMQHTHRPADSKASLKGVENPGLDSADGEDHGGVFTTDASLMPRNGHPYASSRSNGLPNGHSNGYPPRGHYPSSSGRWSNPPGSSSLPSDSTPVYDNNKDVMDPSSRGMYVPTHKPNRTNSDQSYLTLDDPYTKDNSRVSTPDGHKTKRVIHEVVV